MNGVYLNNDFYDDLPFLFYLHYWIMAIDCHASSGATAWGKSNYNKISS